MFANSRFSARPLFGFMQPHEKIRPTRINRPKRAELDAITRGKRISAPTYDQIAEDIARTAVQNRGEVLARQDRWAELSEAICSADANRDHTAGGMPIAELLIYGARADIVHAIETALISDTAETTEKTQRSLSTALLQLDDILGDIPNCYAIASLVVMAHLEIGRACRGHGLQATLPAANRARFLAHVERAKGIMVPYCGLDLNSPLVVATHCAILTAQNDPCEHAVDHYEDLIDLDPQNYRNMRAYGRCLLQRWLDPYEALETQARDIQSRIADIWGKGGYTWVYFDALITDAKACQSVDVVQFIDGLTDILAQQPDQNTVNLLAAYCATALHRDLGSDDVADMARLQIADCANWLIYNHLTEIHPLIWAHASEGFDDTTIIASLDTFAQHGTLEARRAIAEQFDVDLARGLRVTLTETGPRLDPV